jgi:hypothetical protein
MGARRCGDDGLPLTPPSYRTSKSSLLIAADVAPPPGSDPELFPLPRSDLRVAPILHRLDRPPRA